VQAVAAAAVTGVGGGVEGVAATGLAGRALMPVGVGVAEAVRAKRRGGC